MFKDTKAFSGFSVNDLQKAKEVLWRKRSGSMWPTLRWACCN